MLIQKDANVNIQDGRYGNALQAASAGGHLEIAQMLIRMTLISMPKVESYGNALQAALARGHLEIAQMLIQKDANMDDMAMLFRLLQQEDI
ncbi:unnamed protein product [Clonostachys rosea f. rosea IK726]|uniref:Uncharacterized protein n=1 Tax=Clonostachys rosea f. rosea IK726 TaxID=1349383 RepID=A0ACA9UH44_BIOOC|nr:unnamed protein product [Clonostachys rosea f. rosea IK726]